MTSSAYHKIKNKVMKKHGFHNAYAILAAMKRKLRSVINESKLAPYLKKDFLRWLPRYIPFNRFDSILAGLKKKVTATITKRRKHTVSIMVYYREDDQSRNDRYVGRINR